MDVMREGCAENEENVPLHLLLLTPFASSLAKVIASPAVWDHMLGVHTEAAGKLLGRRTLAGVAGGGGPVNTEASPWSTAV